MRKHRIWFWLLSIPLFVAASVFPIQAEEPPPATENEEPVMVGRITHVEGKLLRYLPEKEQWIATGKDTPFGLNDTLHSEEDGRAEIIMPNNTWVRIDTSTRIQLLALKPDITEIDLSAGLARFINKSSDCEIKVVTPFGYVMAKPDTSFDVFVGDTSVEITSIRGTVDFFHSGTESRFEVTAQSTSLLADKQQVVASSAPADAVWDKWNSERESFWSKRIQVKGASAQYLPSGLQYDAYALEKYGRWEKVRYEGSYRHFWRPSHVSAGWTPYTAGSWMVWGGDHCWVPAEPFGYVTHHYGSWVSIGSAWYWAPPVVSVGVHIGAPVVNVGYHWHPGRVAWLHSEARFGWVVLGPGETCYTHRYWGPGSIVAAGVNFGGPGISINSYKYHNHAVIIDHRHLYSVANYRTVIRRSESIDIVNRFHATPVISDAYIGRYYASRKGHAFRHTNARFHHASIDRIRSNYDISRESHKFKAKEHRDKFGAYRKGAFSEEAGIEHPRGKWKASYKESYKRHAQSHGHGRERIDIKEKSHFKSHEKSHYSEKSHVKYKEDFKSHGSFKERGKYHEKASYKSDFKSRGSYREKRNYHEKASYKVREHSKYKSRGFGGGGMERASYKQRSDSKIHMKSRARESGAYRQKAKKHEKVASRGGGKGDR